MKFLVGFGAFNGTFLIYHLIGSSIFPVDENNVLQAPDAYPIIGIALSVLVTVLAMRAWNRQYFPKGILWKKVKWALSSKEKRYMMAEDLARSSGIASESYMQRRLGTSYEEAHSIMTQMEDNGVVSPFDGSTPRRVYGYSKSQPAPVKKPAKKFSASLEAVDAMEGHEFEHWCADLLRKNGFINVEVTQASGDHGVDVLAEKDGVGYAIQCKCYAHDLGNTPVQEVSAGKVMYNRPIGAVMTNRYFTTGAKQLAEKTMTLLWDRDKLQEFLENAGLQS